MSWHKIAFTEAEVEAGAPGRLEKEFRQAFVAAHSPQEAVVFSNELAAAGIEYYFSPEAGRLASLLLTQYRAETAHRPETDHVRLAFGHRPTAERLLSQD